MCYLGSQRDAEGVIPVRIWDWDVTLMVLFLMEEGSERDWKSQALKMERPRAKECWKLEKAASGSLARVYRRNRALPASVFSPSEPHFRFWTSRTESLKFGIL